MLIGSNVMSPCQIVNSWNLFFFFKQTSQGAHLIHIQKLDLSRFSEENSRSGWLGKKKEKGSQEERWFLENGGTLLKELIADCNGKSIPICSFSSSQILDATNNFNSRYFAYHDSTWYEGIIGDRCYLIKLVPESSTLAKPETAYNDIVLSARMSNHINFLKLVGCCLEFRLPVLVFENIEHGFLNERGGLLVYGEEYLLPWDVRLKIGKEIANALTYLHTAFPKIIIHRDVRPMNIVLDNNFTAKLSDLSISITLPEGKSRLETVVIGTVGYLDPLYFETGFVTEYTDVYSFGVFLMVLLTGRPPLDSTRSDGFPQHILSYVKDLYQNGKLNELIDPMIIQDITSGQKLQVEACVVLALRCCEKRDEDRPKMIQVAKELKWIQTSF